MIEGVYISGKLRSKFRESEAGMQVSSGPLLSERKSFNIPKARQHVLSNELAQKNLISAHESTN